MKKDRKITQDGVSIPLYKAAALFAVVSAGFGLWLWMAPVSSAVVAQGRFKVEGSVKTVQHLDGGLISEIAVADGDYVRAGETLLQLDVTESQALLATFLSERDTLTAQKLRLEAELVNNPAPDFTELAAVNRPSADAAITSQRILFEARQQERAAEGKMLNGALTRLATRRVALSAEREAVQSQRETMQQDADSARTLSESGLLTRVNLNARERDLASLIGRDASLEAGIAETDAYQVEAELGYVQSQTRFVSNVSKELAEVVAELAGLKPRIEAETLRIARGRIAAPLDGVVVSLKPATIGGVVAPGEAIMDIVPAEGELIVEARLPPAARERLRVGMTVELRLPGVRARKEQGIAGQIELISAELTEDASDPTRAGGPTYAVNIAMADTPDGIVIEPGMPVTAVIATDARTALSYLLSPLTDAMARSMREE